MMKKTIYGSICLIVLTGIFSLTANPVLADEDESTDDVAEEAEAIITNDAAATDFSLPGEAVPQTGIGGGVRGDVQFGLPDAATPNSSVGGGIRGENGEFALPGENGEFALPGEDSEFALPGENSEFALPEDSTNTTTDVIDEEEATNQEAENSSEDASEE